MTRCGKDWTDPIRYQVKFSLPSHGTAWECSLRHRSLGMPYNEELDARIEKMISRWKNTHKKKMFGGVCHLLNGNMFCGVYKDFLILRLGKKNAEKTLALPYVGPFDITGRPMKGWVMVEQAGFQADDELRKWLNQAKQFAGTLPSK